LFPKKCCFSKNLRTLVFLWGVGLGCFSIQWFFFFLISQVVLWTKKVRSYRTVYDLTSLGSGNTATLKMSNSSFFSVLLSLFDLSLGR
jgi:hypothetical protein